ncbi:alpha/beta hydrolase family protein [Oceanicaulis sp. UBA2681]|uniref:alpha/beta hydrolase family protein n=1 Tax=Oceanicaulis sp. UBA2681 TaxID=1947007 RepID=UPI00257D2A3D|nr:alpha/beta fold hydrolase [Oceanicaulis sp. UBA2681]
MKQTVLSACLALIGGLCGLSIQAHAQTLADFAQLPEASRPIVSPEGRWLAYECHIEVRPSVCVFDLQTNQLAHAMPAPENAWLGRTYFASEDYLVVNLSTYLTLSTVSGLRDYEVSRALSLSLESGEVVMLMERGQGSTNATDLASLNLSDPDSILIQMTFLNGAEGQIGTRFETREGFESGLFRVDLATGDDRRIDRSDIFDRVLDAQGDVVAEIHFDPLSYLYEIKEPGRRGAVIYSATHQSDAPSVLGFMDETGFLAFFPGERGGYRRMDRVSGEITRLENMTLDTVSAPIWDRRQRLMGFNGERDGQSAQFFFDEDLAADAASLTRALGAPVQIVSFSDDRDLLVLAIEEPSRPREFFLYQRSARNVWPFSASYPSLAGTALPARRLYRYAASDGLEIEAVLTTPAGWSEGAEALPLVVLPHGGPAARDGLEFDWWAQAYAAQGYLVLQPNFRGSLGYGLDFQRAGYGEFGDLMVQDIIDGARAVKADGLARSGGYCLAGGSYGGYAALRAAIMAPDEVACVVAFAPVTNPVSLMGRERRNGSFIAYHFWEQYMGDLVWDQEASDRVSILRNAQTLDMPILLLHGTQDSIVPIEASDALRRQLRGAEGFEYVRLEGESHFLDLPGSRMTLLNRSVALFDEVLRAD